MAGELCGAGRGNDHDLASCPLLLSLTSCLWRKIALSLWLISAKSGGAQPSSEGNGTGLRVPKDTRNLGLEVHVGG